MLDQIKGIKASLRASTIREIQSYLSDFQNNLLNYKYENEIDDIKEYQIYKLSKLMQNTDILDLKYNDIVIYIEKLIAITEFIEI